jgi:hypothetical protein
LEPEEFEELTDPAELKARSDLAMGLNSHDRVVSHARLAHQTDGIESLPTGKKLISTYGPGIIPPGFDAGGVGEIIDAVGTNRLSTMASILVLMSAAREAGLQRVIYGAIEHSAEPYLREMFGPAMRPFEVNGSTSIVEVRGPGYPREGIRLATGWGDTKTFLRDVINYVHKRNTKSAGVIISLCEELDAL